MSVAIKPDSIGVKAVSQATGGDRIRQTPDAASFTLTISCYVQELKIDEAFRAVGVEAEGVIKIMVDLADAASFSRDCQISHNSRTYQMIGLPERHDAGDICDHGVVYAQLVNFALA